MAKTPLELFKKTITNHIENTSGITLEALREAINKRQIDYTLDRKVALNVAANIFGRTTPKKAVKAKPKKKRAKKEVEIYVIPD